MATTLNEIYPSLSSQIIFLFLTTGIILEIGVVDLTHAGLFIDSRAMYRPALAGFTV